MFMSTVAKEMQIRQRLMTNGDLGIEIEVEGNSLPMVDKYWKNEEDGSLKGPETREYVLRKPSSLNDVRLALNYLDDQYVANNTQVMDTVRAGVHVHVNCQHLTMTQLYTFMTVYLTLENILVKWCGEGRCGNLFCLRASDAEYILDQIKAAANSRVFREHLYSDNLRYASMNVKALGDYGSLEFRSMRGTRDLNLIFTWAKTLLSLREYSKELNNPSEVIEKFSLLGAEGFMREVLGENYEVFSCAEQEKLLWEGMRNAQDIAFCADWSVFDPKMKKIGQIEFPENADPDEPEEDF